MPEHELSEQIMNEELSPVTGDESESEQSVDQRRLSELRSIGEAEYYRRCSQAALRILELARLKEHTVMDEIVRSGIKDDLLSVLSSFYHDIPRIESVHQVGMFGISTDRQIIDPLFPATIYDNAGHSLQIPWPVWDSVTEELDSSHRDTIALVELKCQLDHYIEEFNRSTECLSRLGFDLQHPVIFLDDRAIDEPRDEGQLLDNSA